MKDIEHNGQDLQAKRLWILVMGVAQGGLRLVVSGNRCWRVCCRGLFSQVFFVDGVIDRSTVR